MDTVPFIVPCRTPVGRSVTDWHENAHQLHAQLRNQYGQRYNAMYKDNGEAFIILEPQLRLSDVARAIPPSLRGMSYRLYLEQQTRWWDDKPLYVLDELGAYLHGSRHPNSEWSDYLQATEFTAYSFYLLKITPTDYTDYNNLKTAIMWATEDAFKYKDNSRVADYRATMRNLLPDFGWQFPASWVDAFLRT